MYSRMLWMPELLQIAWRKPFRISFVTPQSLPFFISRSPFFRLPFSSCGDRRDRAWGRGATTCHSFGRCFLHSFWFCVSRSPILILILSHPHTGPESKGARYYCICNTYLQNLLRSISNLICCEWRGMAGRMKLLAASRPPLAPCTPWMFNRWNCFVHNATYFRLKKNIVFFFLSFARLIIFISVFRRCVLLTFTADDAVRMRTHPAILQIRWAFHNGFRRLLLLAGLVLVLVCVSVCNQLCLFLLLSAIFICDKCRNWTRTIWTYKITLNCKEIVWEKPANSRAAMATLNRFTDLIHLDFVMKIIGDNLTVCGRYNQSGLRQTQSDVRWNKEV